MLLHKYLELNLGHHVDLLCSAWPPHTTDLCIALHRVQTGLCAREQTPWPEVGPEF